jgi:capsular exopolysaccharide synthesis family protein
MTKIDENKQQEFNLREYWQVLVRRRWIIYTCVLVTTVAAVVASLVTTPIYQSACRISIERSGARIFKQNLSSAEPSWLDYQNFYNTQYEIISSRSVLERAAVKGLDLPNRNLLKDDEDPSQLDRFMKTISELKNKAMGAITSGRPGTAATGRKYEMKPYVEFLRGGLSVAPVRDSFLVDIYFAHENPAFAAEAANAIAESYQQFTLEKKVDLAEQSKGFFAERIKQLRTDVLDLEEKVQRHVRENQLIVGSNDKIEREGLLDVSRKLSEAEVEVANQRARLASYLESQKASLPDVRNNSLVSSLSERVAELEADYQAKASRLGREFPEVKNLNSELEEARRQLQQEVEKVAEQVIDSARADLREAQKRAQELKDLLTRTKTEMDARQQAFAEYETLKALADRKRSTLNDLLSRQNDMEVSANLGDLNHNVRIIDAAIPPNGPYKPKRKLNTALGFLFGLFLGVGFAVLIEYVDNTIKTPEDVRKALGGSPVLAMIPSQGPGSKSKRRAKKAAAAGTTGSPEAALVTHQAPNSPAAEAYKELRTALLLTTAGHPPRAVAITSCQPGEGKTTTAVNLATSLGQLGRRVLLVDTDLRRPRCHKVLRVATNRGVSSYLTGMHRVGELVQPSPIDGVSVISAGPVPPNPAELLDSTRFVEFVRELREHPDFDHVIFDTPPVLSVVDPLLIGRQVEGLVLVLRSAFTSREAAQLAWQKLDTGRVKVFGTLLNDVQTEHVPYEYRYYRYGYSEQTKSRGRKRPAASEPGAGSRVARSGKV